MAREKGECIARSLIAHFFDVEYLHARQVLYVRRCMQHVFVCSPFATSKADISGDHTHYKYQGKGNQRISTYVRVTMHNEQSSSLPTRPAILSHTYILRCMQKCVLSKLRLPSSSIFCSNVFLFLLSLWRQQHHCEGDAPPRTTILKPMGYRRLDV
jgi:hypothetical protein